MDGLLSQETTSTGQASTGSRGVTPLPAGVPKLSTSYKVPGKGKSALVYVDSFPSADGWWTPPLHGEDVAYLWNNSELEKLEELRLLDSKRFLEILKAHGCCSIGDQDLLLSCFEKEEGLQPLHKRRANRDAAGLLGVDPPGPDHADYEWLIATNLKTYFNLDWQWGHLVFRTRSCESEVLETHLAAIPECLSDLKTRLEEFNEEAGSAVRNSDWTATCQSYEECLRILESMENGLWTRIHTWLLLWVCIPLVHIYQLWLKNYPKCVAIYDRMLQQLNREDTEEGSEGDGSLGQLYYVIVWHRRLVLFEWSHTVDRKADGDECGHLVSLYLQSKAFNVVAVQNKEAQGFEWLQYMTNNWGRRRGMKSGESDMRVAFCFNLQQLFRISQQWSELVKWMREKWMWINLGGVVQELEIRWKFQDAENLYLAGMVNEAQDVIAQLRNDIQQLEGCMLQKQVFECKILRFKAKFCLDSDPQSTEQLLLDAGNKLAKLDFPADASSTISTELAELNFVRAKVLHNRTRGSQIWRDSPYGVEGPTKQALHAETATQLFTAVDSSGCLSRKPGFPDAVTESRLERLRGRQLLWDLFVHKERHPGQILSSYVNQFSDKYDEAMGAFKKSLELLSQTVHTLQPTRRDEIDCHIELGGCYIDAISFKDPNLKTCDNSVQGLRTYRECHLNTAIQHFQEALDLAMTCGDSKQLRIITGLGSAYFEKAIQLYDQLQEFLKLIPKFLEDLAGVDSNKFKIRLEQEVKCTNHDHVHLHSLSVEEGEVSYAVDQGFKQLKLNREWMKAVQMSRLIQSGSSRVNLYWLIDQFILNFMDDFLEELQQSIDYLLKSLKMDFAIPLDTPKDGHLVFDEVVWERVENSKIRNTKLQFLFCIGFSTCELRQTIGIQRAYNALPEYFRKALGPANYTRIVNALKLQWRHELDPKHPTIQKGLLWAERGRSRILINQIIAANKLHQDVTEISKLINFNFTDKKSWKILRAGQLACGDNTVFVEYMYDTYMEGGYVVQAWAYVMSKGGELDVCTIEMGDPQDLQASLKKIHAYMSGSYDPQSSQAKTIQTDLEKLYDTFIRPISDLLDGMKPEDKLVFALDDVLTNVPFSILLDAKTGKYLIENHTISFTPALRVLAQCNERFKSMCHASQRVGQSVALGDPAYRQDKRLVHSLKEVTKISEFFQDGCVKVITGPEASIDNLLNSVNLPVDTVQGFVHIAAHGLVNHKNRSGSLLLANSKALYKDPAPMKSNTHSDSSSRSSFHQHDQGIVESDEPEEEAFNETLHKFEMLGIGCVRGGSTSVLTEDKCISEKDKKAGILRSENVVKLGFEWRSRMVVLSACNTAKGCVLKTEGVVGLPRAFLVAGVPYVVASQWSLKDEPSSKLMKRFYKEMSRGSDTATAIRAAMLSMKPKKGSPAEVASSVYEWGGYLVWGLPTVTLPPSMLKCSWLPPKPISHRHRRRDDGIHGYNGKHKELWSNHHIEKWIYALFLQAMMTGKWTCAMFLQVLLANTLFLRVLIVSTYLITENVILSQNIS